MVNALSLAVHAPPLLYAVVLWFVSTGAILWLDSLPRRTFAWSLAAMSAVALGGLYGITRTAHDTSAMGAYVAFTSALAVWGWHELTFLTGTITGPRREPCPADATGWRRFKLAAATLIYHEIAIALTAVTIVALTWGAPNQTGTLTFLLLFVMRISTKLNIFAGVPHLSDAFVPDHLAYIKSYFRKGPLGLLFVVTLSAALLIAAVIGGRALGAESGEAVGFTLLFSLVALAILEHGFLVIPFTDTALWRWAKPRKPATQAQPIYATASQPLSTARGSRNYDRG
jgi:putative photosynthetic complex assembly protein 2